MIRNLLLLCLLFTSFIAPAQKVNVSDVIHLYNRLDEDGYVIRYLMGKGLRHYRNQETLFMSDCTDDSSYACQRVMIDWVKKHFYYFTPNEQSYFDWNQQIIFAGYEFKGETQIAGVRKTRYRLRGNNILMIENIYPGGYKSYSLQIYDDY